MRLHGVDKLPIQRSKSPQPLLHPDKMGAKDFWTRTRQKIAKLPGPVSLQSPRAMHYILSLTVTDEALRDAVSLPVLFTSDPGSMFVLRRLEQVTSTLQNPTLC